MSDASTEAADKLREIVVIHKKAKMSRAAIYRCSVELLLEMARHKEAVLADALLLLDDPVLYSKVTGKVG